MIIQVVTHELKPLVGDHINIFLVATFERITADRERTSDDEVVVDQHPIRIKDGLKYNGVN